MASSIAGLTSLSSCTRRLACEVEICGVLCVYEDCSGIGNAMLGGSYAKISP